ncbi:DUF6338 family protein [Leifsonia sp. NPDC058248]|uniref:DUF6338 family protein n=1 Tax=Leifsonia sp. NPDC058248 TaxID=3346402 RepID=UPI0036D973DC
MSIPDSVPQIVLFVLFVLPGITFTTVRVALVGTKAADFSVPARILEALFVSVIFDAVYLFVFGDWISQQIREKRNPVTDAPQPVALLAILMLVIVPALVAVLFYLRIRRVPLADPEGRPRLNRRGKQKRGFRRTSNYRSTPTAWDFRAYSLKAGSFVRVRMESGVYIGGWFSTRSYLSTYPHGRDMYIESQWKIDRNGDFQGKIVGTNGVWVSLTDKSVVEWVDQAPEKESENVR